MDTVQSLQERMIKTVKIHWGSKAAILVHLQNWILGPCIVGQKSHRSTLTISGETGQTATDTHILGEPCIFKVEKEHEGSVFLKKH